MLANDPKRVLIITGEASGDMLGADLMKSLLTQHPQLAISAVGGQLLKKAGAYIILDSTRLAVLGPGETIMRLKDILSAMRLVKNYLRAQKPDLLILIDYPGFNLRMAKVAKKYGIKVFFYVSPQIWAWKYGRIKKIRKYVDHMAVFFPFEEDIYKRERVPVTFVGHPLTELVKPQLSPAEVYAQWNLNPSHPIVALFPGSRHQEIKRLLAVIMRSAEIIRKKIPNVQFVLPLARTLNRDQIQSQIHSDIKIVENHTYDILQVCTAAIAVSGTVTLEIALSLVPLTIIYKVSTLTAIVALFLLRIKHIGLCNIVAEKTIAQELIQYKATPAAIAAETIKIIKDSTYHESIKNELLHMKTKLGSAKAADNAATAALLLVDQ